MQITLIYPILFFFVLVMNIVPGFMPPTWLVLAFFFIHFNLSLTPVIIIGVISATLGRIILYYLAKHYLRRLFPTSSLHNYDALGNFVESNQKLTIPIILTYAFLPIPSNQVFIIAGLSQLNISIIAFSFFIGRSISYTVWISLAHSAADHLDRVFSYHLSSITTVIVEILGLLIIYLVGKINWQKYLSKINWSKASKPT